MGRCPDKIPSLQLEVKVNDILVRRLVCGLFGFGYLHFAQQDSYYAFDYVVSPVSIA